jgi:hypothetical protein
MVRCSCRDARGEAIDWKFEARYTVECNPVDFPAIPGKRRPLQHFDEQW